MPSARRRSVEATELDTAPRMSSLMSASASMNLLTVEPVPTPTISPLHDMVERGAADLRLEFVLGERKRVVRVIGENPGLSESKPGIIRCPAATLFALRTRPSLPLRARSRACARSSRSMPWRARQNTPLACIYRGAARRRPGHAGRADVSQSGRTRRRARQERALHRRLRGDGLRLRRGRHRHAQGAAGQSEAAHVPAAASARR